MTSLSKELQAVLQPSSRPQAAPFPGHPRTLANRLAPARGHTFLAGLAVGQSREHPMAISILLTTTKVSSARAAGTTCHLSLVPRGMCPSTASALPCPGCQTGCPALSQAFLLPLQPWPCGTTASRAPQLLALHPTGSCLFPSLLFLGWKHLGWLFYFCLSQNWMPLIFLETKDRKPDLPLMHTYAA